MRQKQIDRAQKKLRKKVNQPLEVVEKENKQFTDDLQKELATNPKYSLDVDPENKYEMSDTQKQFIKHYVDFKSIKLAAEATGIDEEVGRMYCLAYSSQQEIRRINRAMYQHQFAEKLLSIDEIGGWLSSLITDTNVPKADRLKTMEKVKVAQMILDLNYYKNNAINNPADIIDVDIETEVKNMSVKAIKAMLYSKKEELEKDIPADRKLLPEEEAYLKTLPAKDLLKIINDADKEDNK